MSSPLLVDILAYWNLDDDGSGGVSLVDSTGNGYTLNNYGATLGTGIIAGDAVFAGSGYLESPALPNPSSFSISYWFNYTSSEGTNPTVLSGDGAVIYNDGIYFINYVDGTALSDKNYGSWNHFVATFDGTNYTNYFNGSLVYSSELPVSLTSVNLGSYAGIQIADGQGDEVGVWNRALSSTEVSELYNGGAGLTYPFSNDLYYNNAEADGDWGNILNWWMDSGFTIQATSLPDSTIPVNLYNEVTQNTGGANQCFCASANFWSANFGVGLTLQASGVVNMQGTSLFAGTTTDGVSMHDSSQLTSTSVVEGSVTMRDSSRAFGTILGNATIYYDGGNGQYPIGGTVSGSVTYIGWPAVSPQWFNDLVAGGANDGDFANMDNWWSDDTYTTRPINTVGYQQLPDASTNVYIAPDTGIYANTGDAILVNSITANNGYISNITLTVSNGIVFSGNGNYGTSNSVIYADVTFSGTAYNNGSAIHGNADYKSSTSLVESFNNNSLGRLTSGALYGSNSMTVTIAGGGATALGTNWISRLLHLPWFINV